MDRKQLLKFLRDRPEMLKKMSLLGPQGQVDKRSSDKLREVAGFAEIILRYTRKFLHEPRSMTVLEGSCGKSYLGFALVILLSHFQETGVKLWGVDSNPELVERCRNMASDLGLRDFTFVATRTIEFECEDEFDLVVSLHACDTATDEVIAKGIQLDSRLILAVPCCQNQIRGQIKNGHLLAPMTEYGPVRYRLANMLTDTLRAQFLHSAGYHVEMDEIGSPRLTPKNLCICARKVKRPSKRPRDKEYKQLRDVFGVSPRIESLCPEVLGD